MSFDEEIIECGEEFILLVFLGEDVCMFWVDVYS